MKIGIVGAGITGLAIGYELSKTGHKVIIFEKSSDLGGLIGSIKFSNSYLEKYYHHIFTAHQEIVDLINKIGLDSDLIWSQTKMGFYYNKRIYPFTTPKDLILFKPLRLLDRLRMGISSLLFLSLKNWQVLDNLVAIEFLQKYSGKKSCDVIWQPLLKGKFGSEYNNISAVWLWDRIRSRRTSTKNRGLKEHLGYLRGGFYKLLRKLANEIKSYGGEVLLNSHIESIIAENNVARGLILNKDFYGFSKIIVTLPIPNFIQICKKLPSDYVDLLIRIKYMSSLGVMLRLKRPLSPYYWINISDPRIPFIAIIEHTNLVSPAEYNDNNIVYLVKYLSNEAPFLTLPDEVIIKIYTKYLKQIFPEYNDNWLINWYVFRDRYTQPVFSKNYSKNLPAYKTPIKNLILANTSQFYPESRCMNTSIRLAGRIKDLIEMGKF